jgi:ribonuclease BN (tRNA processing enzyme)
VLGSGGWLPTDRRETACVYLREGEHVLLLDAGTGMRRLVTEPMLLDGVRHLSIALSHFHLDHVAGLIALAGMEVETRELWAPGRVHGSSARELAARLLGAPFSDLDILVSAVHELEGTVEAGPFRIETRIQPLHVGPTLGLKVNGVLAYCTDTAADEATAGFAAGARVLLHDSFRAADRTDDPTHTAAGEAARIAAAADVERLVLVHVDPTLADDAELLRFARPHFVATEVGRDGLAWST